ncbi:MAG: adenylyl-sulfate kinase [Acidocella sp. 20-57-95]|nr:MAG: adenylyl-sulfate kinase [Acidocella sp. 20-57-95]HQT63088.1 sulfate adenylyltransferase subunit CysN [Acidocella sp.]
MSALLKPEAATTERSLLRVLTCGSVDDGKSTLIGRLLYDTHSVPDDQIVTLEKDSKKFGTTGADMDFALLVDGLEAEREQGITIDVAYRFMGTKARKFIIADTPGHEQYTRNMVTGASGAELAILLVDARKGIQVQTRRHAFICALLGIKHIVLAVNKIDLMAYSQSVFETIKSEFSAFSQKFGFTDMAAIPLSARYGDNVASRSAHMPWYQGPTLLAHLEQVDAAQDLLAAPFRLAVQWVNRPNLDFRGFSGTVASGVVRPGDKVTVAGSGAAAQVAKLITYDGEPAEAIAGDAITLVLDREIDASRGDVFADPTDLPEVSEQFVADLVWMSDVPMLPGRSYVFRVGTRMVSGTISKLKYKTDVNSFEQLASNNLALNEIGTANISLSAPVAFDPYNNNRRTGAFIIIDRVSHATLAAGMIRHGLRRATNVHRQVLTVDHAARVAQKGHKPGILWFTGLSGSGKSTIANILEAKLHARGAHTYMLDGDNIRHGLNRDLGFTDVDRVENIRRVAEVAKLFADAGLIVLVSFISPFRAERQLARELAGDAAFFEVFVDTPIDICRQRDPKGLYKKADAGQIANFTGISSPYEAPEAPAFHLQTAQASSEDSAQRILDGLSDLFAGELS